MCKLDPELNPNKETIRRVCSMFRCENCWFLNDNHQSLSVLVDIAPSTLPAFKTELEAWSGYTFYVYSLEQLAENKQASLVQQKGERLLPIDQDVALQDVERRRKKNRSI